MLTKTIIRLVPSMNNNKFLYQELTGKIIHCCIDVHKELGCGFLEKVYQEALAIVFKEEGIEFEREKYLPIQFRGTTLQCDYIADFVVDNKVILELKALAHLEPLFEAQVINYLRATGLQVALLINFGQKELQVKRIAANIY